MINKIFDEQDIKAFLTLIYLLALMWTMFLIPAFVVCLFLDFNASLVILSVWIASILLLVLFAYALKLDIEDEEND